jgi:RimJ/RimL family protein N-acetyltransferase
MTLDSCWPLFGLRIDTPQLTLAVPTDVDLVSLLEVAKAGIHPPDTMPFVVPWTDLPSPQFERSFLQYHWGCRAALSVESLDLHFLVKVDDCVVGMQSVHRRRDDSANVFETGSWLGLPHQGRGIGRAMRAAAVRFAFEYLDAEVVTSGAFVDNIASQRVSLATGYEEVARVSIPRRGLPVEQIKFALTRQRWQNTKGNEPLTVTGWNACRALLIP